MLHSQHSLDGKAFGRQNGRAANGRLVRTAVSAPSTTRSPGHRIPTIQAPYRTTDETIRDIQSLYKSLLHEYDYLVQDAWVEGEIPKDLKGTYFRNGPGLQVCNPRYQRHTFDGDGMVLSFSFDNGRAWFKNKFVRTQGFQDEQAAGRPVHRTAFTRGAADGNPFFNPLDFKLKNVANTGVIHWGGRLLALYESGLPHELDPATLHTIGESTVGGQLSTPVLAAHYRVMPGRQQLKQQQQQHLWHGSSEAHGHANGNGSANGDSSSSSSSNRSGSSSAVSAAAAAADGRTWVGFSFNTGLGDAELLFYEFQEDGQLAVAPQPYKLPGVSVAMIHDIAVTPDYYVVVVGPVNFSVNRFVTEYLTSRCSIAECLMYDPSCPTKIHLVPRARGSAANTAAYIIEAPPMFTFHHVNAFQTAPSSSSSSSAKQQLVLDTVAWDEVKFDNNQYNLTPSYYQGGARSQLRRMVFELDPAPAASASNGSSTGSSAGSSRHGTGRLVGDYKLARRCVEFPSVNWDQHGQPHRHIFCCADRVDDDYYWGPTQCVMKLTLPDPLAGTQAPLTESDVRTELWDAGPRRLVMEPMYVPRQGGSAEDDGWVLAAVHNAATGKGELVILDAQDLAAGPVATIHLQHFLPAGLHGSFTPEVFGHDGSDAAGGLSAEPTWKEPNVVRGL